MLSKHALMSPSSTHRALVSPAKLRWHFSSASAGADLTERHCRRPAASSAAGQVRARPFESRAGARVRRLALLCAALRRGIAAILVKKDRAEVCPLSRGMMSAHRLNPYPPHYRPAFASSAFLGPHPPQPPSRAPYLQPERIRVYRVPPQ